MYIEFTEEKIFCERKLIWHFFNYLPLDKLIVRDRKVFYSFIHDHILFLQKAVIVSILKNIVKSQVKDQNHSSWKCPERELLS